MSVYLDFNASAPIDPRVLDYMIEVYKTSYGNADSRTHDFGESARKVVEDARAQFADLLGIKKDEVFFTSGATESNNIALQGLRAYANETGKKHIITTSIEHKAVLETAKHLKNEGFEVDFVDPDESGRVSADIIKSKVRDNTLLVSVMHVNNETGIIQPVQELGEYLADQGIRPGTIPVALVAGLGKACELVALEYEENQKKQRRSERSFLNCFVNLV